ncbi:DUF4278 domain-containing protein [Pleurocapsales cyanobacterium LEGE 06147]|nr:DUF4278 domain-containing protein [Pleurocapsales cyanobacterium LEGE 06147]
MELRYRGVSYQPQAIEVETFASDIQVKFLGKTYPLRLANQVFKFQTNSRKYRGIAYGN